MHTVETSQRAGPDGKLHLEIPVDKVGQLYHIVVILDEKATDSHWQNQWPVGYMDSVVGQWQGEFTLGSEGPYEHREPL
jgi:hypothetical protein